MKKSMACLQLGTTHDWEWFMLPIKMVTWGDCWWLFYPHYSPFQGSNFFFSLYTIPEKTHAYQPQNPWLPGTWNLRTSWYTGLAWEGMWCWWWYVLVKKCPLQVIFRLVSSCGSQFHRGFFCLRARQNWSHQVDGFRLRQIPQGSMWRLETLGVMRNPKWSSTRNGYKMAHRNRWFSY